MKKYEKYKDSGIDWIGEVPENWAIKRLKNLAGNVSGKSSEIADDDFLVALENIESNSGKFIESSTEYENNGITFKKSHLLYNKLRPYLNKVYLAEKDGICVGDIIVVECSKKLLPKFLQYKMLSDDFCSIVMSSVQGTKMPRTSWEFISSLKFGIPTLEEQLTIANYLDDQTQKFDRLISNKKAQAEKLKELRQIEINNAVTKGLNPNAEMPASSVVEMKDSGIEWLGKIPRHWEVKRLKNVANINSTKQELKFEEIKDVEVVFLAMESVSENGQIDNSEKRPVSELWEGFTYFQKDDVIIAKITPCFENGKGAWLNSLESDFGFGSTEFHTARGYKNRLDNQYFYFVTKSDLFMKIGEAFMTGSAGQKRVSTDFVLNFKIGIPPIEEQIAIANYLHHRTAAIDQLIKNIEAQIEKLQELRKIRIYEAVTGKIKVNEYGQK